MAMYRQIFTFVLIWVLLCLFGCSTEQTALQPVAAPTASPSPNVETDLQEVVFPDSSPKISTLRLPGYTVIKQNKRINVASIDEEPQIYTVEHAVLRRNGRTVVAFDPLEHPLATADFAVFELLKSKPKQLVVSHTAPRAGRHWIVNLDPKFQILFDSRDYEVGLEDIVIIDIDQDGNQEITMPVVVYGFDNFNSSKAELATAIFAYDAQKQRYLPANQKFQDYALRNVEQLKAQIDRTNQITQFFSVLRVTIDYIYAGREQEGWEFFDREYNFDNKQEIKSTIQSTIASEPVYQFIYNNR